MTGVTGRPPMKWIGTSTSTTLILSTNKALPDFRVYMCRRLSWEVYCTLRGFKLAAQQSLGFPTAPNDIKWSSDADGRKYYIMYFKISVNSATVATVATMQLATPSYYLNGLNPTKSKSKLKDWSPCHGYNKELKSDLDSWINCDKPAKEISRASCFD